MKSITCTIAALAVLSLACSGQDKGRSELVEVTLKNGAVFKGLALEGQRVEARMRGTFEVVPEAEKHRVGRGIRLWYYHDIRGYLFIEYRRVAKIEVVRQVSNSDVAGLQTRLEAGKPDPLRKMSDRGRLLDRFPPKKYTPELYTELRRNRVLYGIDPNTDQRDWIGVYGAWAEELADRERNEALAKKDGDSNKDDKKEESEKRDSEPTAEQK